MVLHGVTRNPDMKPTPRPTLTRCHGCGAMLIDVHVKQKSPTGSHHERGIRASRGKVISPWLTLPLYGQGTTFASLSPRRQPVITAARETQAVEGNLLRHIGMLAASLRSGRRAATTLSLGSQPLVHAQRGRFTPVNEASVTCLPCLPCLHRRPVNQVSCRPAGSLPLGCPARLFLIPLCF